MGYSGGDSGDIGGGNNSGGYTSQDISKYEK